MDTPVVMWFCDPPALYYRGEEEVALLMGEREERYYRIRSALLVPNRAEDKRAAFQVWESDVPNGRDGVASIIGSVHSHSRRRPEPSAADLVGGRHRHWIGATVSGITWRWYLFGQPVEVHEVGWVPRMAC